MLNEIKSRFLSGKTQFFTILLFILSFQISNAQWQPEVRLTNDPAGSFTFRNSIAANGNLIHVVFYDKRDNNSTYEIYYKRSTDGGLSFGADVRLTNDAATSYNPAIAYSGSVLHVVWTDNRDGNYEIYYKRSTDDGLSWEADTRLTNNSFLSNYPSISASGLNLHLVWHDTRDGNAEIYYKNSTDGGNTWSVDMRLSNTSGLSYVPSVAVSGSFVHVAWYDSTAGNWEIYYKRSTDGGISWGADTRLTNDPANSTYPYLGVSGSVVHLVWTDRRNGTDNIYYKRSTNGGTSWAADFRLTKNNYNNIYASLAINGPVVHLIFQRAISTFWDIFYNKSTNDGVKWGNEVQLTNNPSGSTLSSIAVSGSAVHIEFVDDRDGNYEIYYKQNLTGTGRPIGISNINAELPNKFALSQNYPNPFNPTTKIKFGLPNSSFAKLVVYDALGREVETLVNEQLNAGTYEAVWSADKFSSGVYYYKLTSGDFSQTNKMILIK